MINPSFGTLESGVAQSAQSTKFDSAFLGPRYGPQVPNQESAGWSSYNRVAEGSQEGASVVTITLTPTELPQCYVAVGCPHLDHITKEFNSEPEDLRMTKKRDVDNDSDDSSAESSHHDDDHDNLLKPLEDYLKEKHFNKTERGFITYFAVFASLLGVVSVAGGVIYVVCKCCERSRENRRERAWPGQPRRVTFPWLQRRREDASAWMRRRRQPGQDVELVNWRSSRQQRSAVPSVNPFTDARFAQGSPRVLRTDTQSTLVDANIVDLDDPSGNRGLSHGSFSGLTRPASSRIR